MSYWWVNHKQTYASEIDGGYIWSPKENTNGAKNQTYINLTLAKPGDIIFSYAAGAIKAVGVVTGAYREKPKPSEFGKAGDVWSNYGWEVPVNWTLLSSPIRPKEHIDEIAPLLPAKHSPLQANGNGNQGCYLASISDDLGCFLINLSKLKSITAILSTEEVKELEEQRVIDEITNGAIETTEKEQLIKARKGQGKFRQNVEKIETGCRVTGVDSASFLIASHIKPWRDSSNYERLDGHNGLLLSPHIDKLFDQGWITFSASGDVFFSDSDIVLILSKWGVSLPMNVGPFCSRQSEYLEYHRNNIFRR